MYDAPLRRPKQGHPPKTVVWPGADSGPDPWGDGFWRARDEAGAIDWDTLPEPELLYDHNELAWGGPTIDLDTLVRVTADLWPAVGMEGPELVLGPMSLFASRQRLRIVVAGCAFLWAHDRWPSVFLAWCRSKPRPSVQVRERVRTVAIAPWALWRVEHRDGELWLHDHTGLGEPYCPDGPVRVIGEHPTGDGLAARVTRDDRGWVAHTALDMPRLPDRDRVQGWVREELRLARTFRPEIRIEPMLRHRPIVVRRAYEDLALDTTWQPA